MRYIIKLLTVIISALALSAITLAATAPEVYGGAEIRLKEPNGIRVRAMLSVMDAEDERTTEYGFLVTRKVFLTGNNLEANDLTLECSAYFDKGIAKGVVDGDYVNKYFEKTAETLYFAGYFFGISPRYYNDMIVVRPYLINSGEVFYGDPYETSLYETAKSVYEDKETYYNYLSEEEQQKVFSVIVAVDGIPYELDRRDFRIVLSSCVVKNANPTYSVCYDLFDPYTGQVHEAVMGRKKSKNYDEIAGMVVDAGTVVPMYDGVVQDTTKGYITSRFNETEPSWIGSCDVLNEEITYSAYDESLSCKICIDLHVTNNGETAGADAATPVFVFDGSFENPSFIISDMEKLSARDKSLLCYNTAQGDKEYADYVKAYIAVSDGACEYILVVVNDGENGVYDDRCSRHDECDVTFLVGEKEHFTQTVEYGGYASTPENPEIRQWDKFCGWALTEDTDEVVADPSDIAILEDTQFYAVIIINPNSDEFMENLSLGKKQLDNLARRASGARKKALNYVSDCISYVIDDACNGKFIDKDYVKLEYSGMVQSVKNTVYNEMTESERSQFLNQIKGSVNKDVQDFLIDYFGIDLSAV